MSGASSGQAGAGHGGEGDGGEGDQGGSSGQGGSSAQGGAGGTSEQGGAGGSGAQGGSSGNGGSAEGGGPPTRCPDLDVNGVLDCDETIAINPDFDSDVLPWIAESYIVLDWHETDAHGVMGSGSLSVENRTDMDQSGSSQLSARQCIPVLGNTVYNFAVEVSVPAESVNTQGGFILFVYDGPFCTGGLADNPVTSNPLSNSEWTVAQKTYLTPASAQSVMMRLGAQKLFRDPPRKVFYDNVLVRKVE